MCIWCQNFVLLVGIIYDFDYMSIASLQRRSDHSLRVSKCFQSSFMIFLDLTSFAVCAVLDMHLRLASIIRTNGPIGFEYYLAERRQTFWLLDRLSSPLGLHGRLIGLLTFYISAKAAV